VMGAKVHASGERNIGGRSTTTLPQTQQAPVGVVRLFAWSTSVASTVSTARHLYGALARESGRIQREMVAVLCRVREARAARANQAGQAGHPSRQGSNAHCQSDHRQVGAQAGLVSTWDTRVRRTDYGGPLRSTTLESRNSPAPRVLGLLSLERDSGRHGSGRGVSGDPCPGREVWGGGECERLGVWSTLGRGPVGWKVPTIWAESKDAVPGEPGSGATGRF